MANEGFLGRTTIKGERAATDDHPVIIHTLPLVAGLTHIMHPGAILKRVDIEEDGKVVDYAYTPMAKDDTAQPCAVVDSPCDPTRESSAIAVVHGCVKARVLTLGIEAPVPAGIVTMEKLKESGIFAV